LQRRVTEAEQRLAESEQRLSDSERRVRDTERKLSDSERNATDHERRCQELDAKIATLNTRIKATEDERDAAILRVDDERKKGITEHKQLMTANTTYAIISLSSLWPYENHTNQ
jgi:septal ring factor EnvC (AmiA/AmiB activator)